MHHRRHYTPYRIGVAFRVEWALSLSLVLALLISLMWDRFLVLTVTRSKAMGYGDYPWRSWTWWWFAHTRPEEGQDDWHGRDYLYGQRNLEPWVPREYQCKLIFKWISLNIKIINSLFWDAFYLVFCMYFFLVSMHEEFLSFYNPGFSLQCWIPYSFSLP